jgi:hypothetical protein
MFHLSPANLQPGHMVSFAHVSPATFNLGFK